MTQRERIEAKRSAVIARWEELGDNFKILAGMFDEQKLDALILALGIGRVELD